PAVDLRLRELALLLRLRELALLLRLRELALLLRLCELTLLLRLCELTLLRRRTLLWRRAGARRVALGAGALVPVWARLLCRPGNRRQGQGAAHRHGQQGLCEAAMHIKRPPPHGLFSSAEFHSAIDRANKRQSNSDVSTSC